VSSYTGRQRSPVLRCYLKDVSEARRHFEMGMLRIIGNTIVPDNGVDPVTRCFTIIPCLDINSRQRSSGCPPSGCPFGTVICV